MECQLTAGLYLIGFAEHDLGFSVELGLAADSDAIRSRGDQCTVEVLGYLTRAWIRHQNQRVWRRRSRSANHGVLPHPEPACELQSLMSAALDAHVDKDAADCRLGSGTKVAGDPARSYPTSFPPFAPRTCDSRSVRQSFSSLLFPRSESRPAERAEIDSPAYSPTSTALRSVETPASATDASTARPRLDPMSQLRQPGCARP